MPFLFQLTLATNLLSDAQKKQILAKEAADAKPMPGIPGDLVTGKTYVLSNTETTSLIVGSPVPSNGLPGSHYVVMYRKGGRNPEALNFSLTENGKLVGVQKITMNFPSITSEEIRATPQSVDKLNMALTEMRDQTKRRENIATVTKGDEATIIAMPNFIMTIMSPKYPENSTGHYLIMLNPQKDKPSDYVSKHAFIDRLGGFVSGEVKASTDVPPSRMGKTIGLTSVDLALDEVVKSQDKLETEKKTITLPRRPSQKI